MDYNVKLTKEFLDEITEICDYISNDLKNINASNRLRRKVINKILLLEHFPKKYAEIEKIDNVKRVYRRLTIDNFVILYTIDDEKKAIYIAHIYYGGSNYLNEQ